MRDYLTDFLAGHPASRDFFRASFLSKDERVATVKQAAQKQIHPVILGELKRLNGGKHAELDRALTALENERAAFVITGQQLGVLGGPLFTLCKVLSAVKMARQLSAESGIKVLPLFWLQAEDHDFAEVSSTAFFSKGEELKEFRFSPGSPVTGESVGKIEVRADGAGELGAFLDELPDCDLELVARLKRAYAPGHTLTQAFSDVLHEFLGRYGLLLFDPLSRTVKECYREFIVTAFFRNASISRVLQDRAESLRAAGYPLQVALRPMSPLFFFSHDGKRERLEERDDGRFEGENGFVIHKDALLKTIDAEPHRFTTSALIRPVFQDTIFPTAAYIAGPAEFGYWTQLKSLYQHFNCLQPLVVPRARVVVVEHRYRQLMHKTGATVADLTLSNEKFVQTRLRNSEFDSERIFSELHSDVGRRINALGDVLDKVDPTLKQALVQTADSVAANIGKLRGKYERALAQREGVIVSQFERIRNALLPRKIDQERVINMCNYILRYGAGFLDKLYETIDPLEGSVQRALYLDPARSETL